MRVLTRLFPFILESDLTEWQEQFWWTKRRKRPRGMTQGPLKIKGAGLDMGEAGDGDEEEGGEVLFEGAGGNEGDIPLVQAPISRGAGGEDMERSKPLAEELLDTVLDLLSFAGFAVPASVGQGTDSRVTLAIWYDTLSLEADCRETGVGCNTPVGTTKPLESNKIETLRLLLSIISSPIYTTGGTLYLRIV